MKDLLSRIDSLQTSSVLIFALILIVIIIVNEIITRMKEFKKIKEFISGLRFGDEVRYLDNTLIFLNYEDGMCTVLDIYFGHFQISDKELYKWNKK